MQEINLDWILTKIKNILRFVPDDGAVGQILRRTAHGAEWSNEQGGGGAVSSVNGQTGDVVLTASDVGALSDTTPIPDSTSDLINDSGFVNAAGAAAAAPVQSVNGQTGAVIVSGGAVDSVNGKTGTVVLDKTDIGLGNVDNVQQYSATNPPPYPVTSVNSQTGAVSLTIPDSTSDLINDSGFVNAAGAAAAAPVQSVNGQTGAVTIPSGGIYQEGTNYIKYADGTMVEWKLVSLGFLAINTAWGAWYYSAQQSLGTWEEPFYSIKGMLAQAYIATLSGGGDFMVGRITDASATSRGKCYLYAPVSLSTTPVEIMVYGIGRWKA